MEDPRCPSATIAPRRNPLSPPDNLPISMVCYLHPPVPASGFLLLHLPPSCPRDVGRLPDACQPSRGAPCASNLARCTSAPVLGQTWLSSTSCGVVQLPGNQGDDRPVVLEGLEPVGTLEGGFDCAGEALDDAVGDPGADERENPVPVPLEGLGGLDHRGQPGMGRPGVPAPEGARGHPGVPEGPEPAEGELDVVGPRPS